MTEPEYDKGGVLPPGTTLIRIDPDECFICAEDVRAGRFRCCRADHPTETSDCGRRRD